MSAEVVEPVSWQARLRRSPDVLYTEVAGLPVLCDPSDRVVHVLNLESVGLWVRLDGRPVADVVGEAREAWDAAGQRAVLDLLRRLKAVGLVEDAPRADADADADAAYGAPVASVTSLRVRGHLDGSRLVLARGSEASERVVAVADPPRSVVLPERLQAGLAGYPEVLAFAGWARAVVDVEELARPGVLDALAGLAESVPCEPRSDAAQTPSV